MSFCFFLYLWNHFVCALSLLPLITAPSPGLYRFFNKCEILPWNLSSQNSPWVWPGGLCNFCSLLQCKQEREPGPRLLQCAACVQEAELLGSISGMFIALLSPAGPGPCALLPQGSEPQRAPASGGPSSCWRSAGAGQQRFSGTAEGFFFFQRGDGNNCNAPIPPAPKRMSAKLQAKVIPLFSTAALCQVLARPSSGVQLRPWMNPSLLKASPFFTSLHFLPSSSVLCYLGFGTFWEWSFSLQNADGHLGSFSLPIKFIPLIPRQDEAPTSMQWCLCSH